MDTLKMPMAELTDDDVLHVDPVHEYERRFQLRETAEMRLAQVHDDADPMVAQGRPTGP